MRVPTLVTMQGPGDLQFSDLSNFEAGYLVLHEINKAMPGITWGQLAALRNAEAMGWSIKGLVRSAGSSVMDVGRAAGGAVASVTRTSGNLIGDAFSATGEGVGSAVRLLTDKKVIDGANSSYKSFTDSGGVGGAVVGNDFFGLTGGGEGEDEGAAKGIWDFIVNLGAGAKAKANAAQAPSLGNIPGGVLPWAIGGGVVLLLALRRR